AVTSASVTVAPLSAASTHAKRLPAAESGIGTPASAASGGLASKTSGRSTSAPASEDASFPREGTVLLELHAKRTRSGRSPRARFMGTEYGAGDQRWKS